MQGEGDTSVEITIRPAVVGDAAAVAAVKQAVWPHETVDAARIADVMQSGEHTTLLADLESRLVGFVDAFSTQSSTGELRWEVDLLAVHPQFQGRGIGRVLVEAVTLVGQGFGEEWARALVQIHNTASQRVFARCGYICDGVVRDLYVAMRGIAITQSVLQDTNLIRVRTFNYSGLWLEGHLTIASLSHALNSLAANPDEYGLAGVLVSASEATVTEAALSLGYTRVAAFQWWRRDFGG